MLAVVGGKAANLGELLAAGLPVPDGFCLTTAAYRQATDGHADGGTGLLGAVHEALKTTTDTDLPALAALAGRARDAIRAAPVPPDIAAAIESAYQALGDDVPVAVRSSATAEDLPSASFAGQQDTYLNVVGAAAVVEAVRDCWASLWTDRAVSYRATRDIDPAAVALAVVVQRMVDATAAGVLFTANPLTNRRQQAVIDASPGLGEAVVSGAVNPDHFVVDPVSGRVLERRLGDKRIAVRPLTGGGTHTVAVSNGGATACLTDRQAAELAALGLRVEQHFGAPQDIEWAIDGGGRLWLTQARPITTLFPVPQRPAVQAAGTPAAAAGTRVYLCLSLAQGLTRPLTPMGLAAFRLIASSAARAAHFDVPQPYNGPSPYAEAGQRMYFDLTAVARSTIGRRIVPRVFDVMEARSATVLRTIFEDPRFSVTRRTPLSLLRHLGPIAVRARVPEALLRAALRPETALRRTNRLASEFRNSLQPPAGATALQRLDHAEHILGVRLFSVVPSILPLPALGFASLGLVGKLLGGGRWDDLQVVLRGLPNNVTTEMDLELWRLAQVIRNDRESRTAMTGRTPAALTADFRAGQLPSVLQAGLARFMDQYGHRAVAEIDVGMPRWSDDPTHIIGVLANYLRLDDCAVPPDVQFSNAAEAAEAQIDRLVAEARGRGKLRGAVVKAALRRARLFTGLRELPKFQLVVALAEVRKQLTLAGTALTAAGALDAPDDVFFLNLPEARAGLRRVAEGGPGGQPGTGRTDLRGLVAERRAAYALEVARRHVPRVLLSDGTEPESVQPAGSTGRPDQAGILSGSPASAGTVTAAARVILDPVGAHLEPGEILVAPSTDPGWTPLFLTAGGLVMEMGGPNSHGAVVAREYGIPAVVGVPDATLRLTTGQQITVDGSAGTVVTL
ncbi:PEP/pyruvate-binding domain-containing protein [Pseudarthrobacter sp. H3Y2-7]|uniref:PEP/pyruvate-binding domain-containing protein n=1 Tax=Pseudarthrobacter naphthalenicus TaxID=3031328 RepID=UPI0023AFFA35|nr:PEP/pyruvate-binding domain-containing protein [Pseudarthrobacter sp. H3Y2-7]MDE8668677.1 PEP/pyruvate-binding domain-containing protein [Pseudarthrobacter sp. H3Y2-7]